MNDDGESKNTRTILFWCRTIPLSYKWVNWKLTVVDNLALFLKITQASSLILSTLCERLQVVQRRESGRAEPLVSVSSSSPASSQICCHQGFKATVVALLLWNMLVGCAYFLVALIPIASNLEVPKFNLNFVLGVLSIVQMLYPVGGLLADVFCGRYRIIIISILVICCAFFLMSISGIFYAINSSNDNIMLVVTIVLAILAIISFVFGFSGFKSNAIQVSLDQLLDASSEKISLFLHWFVWTECIGRLVVRFIVIAIPCNPTLEFKTAGFASLVFLTLSANIKCSMYILGLFYTQ